MKPLLLLVVTILSLAGEAQARTTTNYQPDNQDVRLSSTNLPIVWLDVNGKYIDRTVRITAKMEIIHNGDGELGIADVNVIIDMILNQ